MPKNKIDPNPWNIEMMPVERPIAEAVDSIIRLANRNGSKSLVRDDRDWETIAYIYKVFSVLYPKTTADFINHMKTYRQISNKYAVGEEKGGAHVQRQLEMPKPLYQMINAIFPDQRWDKQFKLKFAKKFPLFAGAEKL